MKKAFVFLIALVGLISLNSCCSGSSRSSAPTQSAHLPVQVAPVK